MPDSYRIQLGLPAQPSETLPPELYPHFAQVFQAIQNLLRGVSQYCGIDAPTEDIWSALTYQETLLAGNLTRMYPVASVAITRGQVINLFNNAGVLSGRLAVATSATTMAHGVANSDAAIGERFEMNWLRGTIDSIGGLTLGTLYWLSTTAGAIQNTAPVAAGQIQQQVGLALTASTLLLDIPLTYRQL